jgi:hypothetical protein
MEISAFLGHRIEDTQNITLLKDFYAGKAINSVAGTLDMDVVSRMFTDSPTWHVCPGFPDGGTYCGIDEIFGTFYLEKIPKLFAIGLYAIPEVFIDGGDVVSVLGFYKFAVNKGDPLTSARFSHTWKIAPDGRIEGVWQVADSHVFQEALNAE